MPVYECSNGKYRIGDGECIYTTRDNAESAYRAYLAEEGKDGKEEKADTNLWQLTAAYNAVVERPGNHAKLSGKTA